MAFMMIQALAENKELSSGQLARTVGRSVSRVSHILAALRLAEVVRYETDGTHARYRLKHLRETHKLFQALSEFIDSASPSRRWLLVCAIAQLRQAPASFENFSNRVRKHPSSKRATAGFFGARF
jgi:DNA-binding IclR family transcriptional regulator